MATLTIISRICTIYTHVSFTPQHPSLDNHIQMQFRYKAQGRQDKHDHTPSHEQIR